MSRTGQEEQIIYALQQAETGKKVGEICREMGVTSRRRFTVEPRSDREVEPNPCRPRECRLLISPPPFQPVFVVKAPPTTALRRILLPSRIRWCSAFSGSGGLNGVGMPGPQTHLNSAMIVILHTSVKARSSRGSWRTLTSGTEDTPR